MGRKSKFSKEVKINACEKYKAGKGSFYIQPTSHNFSKYRKNFTSTDIRGHNIF